MNETTEVTEMQLPTVIFHRCRRMGRFVNRYRIDGVERDFLDSRDYLRDTYDVPARTAGAALIAAEQAKSAGR